MRAFLLSGVAVLALMGTATVSQAASKIDNVQVNIVSPQTATTSLDRVGVGSSLDISTVAVGNVLSVDGVAASKLSNVQANIGSPQKATSSYDRTFNTKVKVATTAVGNSASVTGGSVEKLGSLQVNALGGQTATFRASFISAPELSATTVAVGNSLSLTDLAGKTGTDGSFVGQANFLAGQTATTAYGVSPSLPDTVGSIDATTQAIGNVASITSASDVRLGDAGQANILSPQVATTDIKATVGGDVTLATTAVGNSLDITSNYGDVSVGGGLLSGQINVGSPQVASTTMSGGLGNNWASKLDVNTTAAGNVANLSAATGDGTIGGHGLLPGDDYSQVNLGSGQFASTLLSGVGGVYNGGTIATTAIGNSLSLDSGAIVRADTIQSNTFSPQVASTGLGFSGFGAATTINTSAIGNDLNLTGASVHAQISQTNAFSSQTATTGIGFGGVPSPTISTQAIGNAASISVK